MQNRKPFSLLTLLSAILLPFGSLHAATLTIDTTEPTGPAVVIANPHTTFTTGSPGPLGERDTFTTVLPAGASVGSRGQSFLMPDNPIGSSWDLGAITVRADASANGNGVAQDLTVGGPNTLKLWIFEWNPGTDANDGAQWILGDGAGDNDPFNGTNVTNFLVNGESFDVTRTFSGDFLHFNTPGVQLAENTAYGILLSFESLPAGFKLDDVRDGAAPTGQSYPNGGILRSDSASNSVGSNGDDLVFYVEATQAVPEPATATIILGLGSIALLASRRRRQR